MNSPADISDFESRKREHIELALRAENEAIGLSGFSDVTLEHEALPEIDFNEVEITNTILGKKRPTPFLVSSMTAGHAGSIDLNKRLAEAAGHRGWLMGVGSQRRELTDRSVSEEWREVRKAAPKAQLLGNLGLSQLIQTSNDAVKALVDAIEAEAMIIHLNPLQECLQPNGTPFFRGGLKRLGDLKASLNVPLVIKETGCGFSETTLKRLNELGVDAVDASGFGGTHWGRIEGQRSLKNSLLSEAAETFANWGISTLDVLLRARALQPQFEVWASGGVRSGLDAAKALALGARCVGFAKPILEAALKGEEELAKRMEIYEYELRTALFCTGSLSVEELKSKRVSLCRQVK